MANSTLGNPEDSELKFGIRNGSRSVLVDSVELIDDQGKTVFYDNFYWNTHRFLKAFSISFLFLFSLLLLITMFAKTTTGVYYFLTASTTLGAISVLIWCSFYFYFSHMYPIAQSNIAPPTLTYSYRWIHSSSALDQTADYQKLLYGKISLPKKLDRIVFFGSSQTFGEGSRIKSESWANTLFLKLKRSGPVSDRFIIKNEALKGSVAKEQKKILLAMSDLGKNDLILIDLGNNDRSPNEFKNNMTEMLDFIKKQSSQALLILEPNDPQINSSHLEENHKIMKELCASYQVPCFDMHRYLMSPGVFDTGFMWWDHVHPTSYGHSLIADVLARLLLSGQK
ncbi:MAG: SGNH/GDSL hydrolase family protein [Pseudobdellovibrio sp.]